MVTSYAGIWHTRCDVIWTRRGRVLVDILSTPMGAAYISVVTVLLGLIMGSFLNCVAWRITQGERWTSGRSHCDSCGHVLELRDLIPVLSWLSTKGNCRYCGQHVSARNPLTEVLTAAVYLAIVWTYGLGFEALEMMGFASVLLVLSLTDLDDYFIPNGCILAAVIIRALYILVVGLQGGDAIGLAVGSLISALVVSVPLLIIVLIMDRVMGQPSMGGGDLKLFAVAGLYFGWQRCLFLVIVSCLLGLLFALISQHVGSSGEDAGQPESSGTDGTDDDEDEELPARAFPFGPAIAVACVITMLFGNQVLAWYLSLLV